MTKYRVTMDLEDDYIAAQGIKVLIKDSIRPWGTMKLRHIDVEIVD
jgi:hypothetical protein